MNNSTIKNVCLMACLLLVVIGCAPKYTASFRNSSNYIAPVEKSSMVDLTAMEDAEHQNLEITEVEDNKAPSSNELFASKETKVKPLAAPKVDELIKNYEHRKELIKASDMTVKEENKALRKEKKELKRSVKKEVKEVVKAYKKQQKDIRSNQKVYIGVIVAAAGIVVAILASGPLGGLAIIVGVALIAWGLIEQGSI